MKRDYRHGSVVCVCSSAYCDTLPKITQPSSGRGTRVTTSKDGDRWKIEDFSFHYNLKPVDPGKNIVV